MLPRLGGADVAAHEQSGSARTPPRRPAYDDDRGREPELGRHIDPQPARQGAVAAAGAGLHLAEVLARMAAGLIGRGKAYDSRRRRAFASRRCAQAERRT